MTKYAFEGVSSVLGWKRRGDNDIPLPIFNVLVKPRKFVERDVSTAVGVL